MMVIKMIMMVSIIHDNEESDDNKGNGHGGIMRVLGRKTNPKIAEYFS